MLTTQEDTISARETIERLFGELDAHKPGWEDLVDLNTLDFSDPDEDLAAQTGTMHLFRTKEDWISCGLLVPEDDWGSLRIDEAVPKYALLTLIATTKIKERLLTRRQPDVKPRQGGWLRRFAYAAADYAPLFA